MQESHMPAMPCAAPDFSLRDKLALITGSTQGLGFAIACAYAASGARVILNGRNLERLELAARRLTERTGHVPHAWQADVSDIDRQEQAYAALCADAGVPDILVNNVGVRLRSSMQDSTTREIAAHLHTNLTSCVTLSRQAAGAMLAAGSQGRIVTMTSIAGMLARAGDAVYPIAKQGLAGMVRSLAVEYGRHGITSNGIAPGTFATESNAALAADPVKGRHVVGRNPLERWARPDEIAGAAVFLASPAASYVNGHILVVDGGFSITF
ncbi:SDR family oxidoreductase [Paracandidimonas soli]